MPGGTVPTRTITETPGRGASNEVTYARVCADFGVFLLFETRGSKAVVLDDAREELGALTDDTWRHIMRFASFRDLTLMARLNSRFAEFVRSELDQCGRVVIRSQRRVARTMIRGWRPVNRRFDEQRRTANERNARLAASYPNPDVNDLLASVNELSQILFEHPMHTLVQVIETTIARDRNGGSAR